MPLSPSQYESFGKSGYVKLPGAILPPLLQKLRELFESEMSNEGDLTNSRINNNGKTYITNLELLCSKGNLAALELLGQPFLLEIAAQICGPDFFMIQEFAVIKQAGDELPVLWHQDMVHEGNGRCFTIGFYLDHVYENDGALRVVPGSHTSGRSICELQREPFIEVPMDAGDVLVHDMMLAHSSEPLRQHTLRRVLYFEFVSRRHVLTENIYSDELVKNRTRLIHAARELYRLRNKLEHHPFEWENELAGTYEPVHDIKQVLEEIYSMPINARPSSYCFEHTPSTNTSDKNNLTPDLPQLLQQLCREMDAAAIAYQAYLSGGKTFRFAQQLKLHNTGITELLLHTRFRLSPGLRDDADALLYHLQVWTAKWDALALQLSPAPDDVFVFENEVTFPRQAAQNLEAYMRSLS